MWFLENAWLIFAIPAATFFLIIFFGKRLPLKGAELAILSMMTSLVLSLGAAIGWIQRVDDAHGGNEGTLRLLGAVGRSLIPRAEEAGGHESSPFVAPVIR